MSEATEKKKMAFFERYLSVWVALCIGVGILIGYLAGDGISFLSDMEIYKVNLPIAILIWMMIYPMMLQIDFSSIKGVGKAPKGLIMTVIINWLIKPFTMAFFAWIFFEHLYSAFIDPDYTLVQVSVNDLIILVAFIPLVGFLLGITDITIPYGTLAASIIIFVVIPLVAGVITNKILVAQKGEKWFQEVLLPKFKPISIIALLLTLILLFAFQGPNILDNPIIILLIAVPLILQTYFIFFIAWFAGRKLKLSHAVCSPAAMIGASNFFELAVAVAIALFGLQSPAALVTVVGVLVEVPVMLSLVTLANKWKY